MMQYDDYDEPRYVISIVTKLVDLHPQTIRHYESVGLVIPSRSKGNVRLYSQRDVDLLRKITRLTQDLGVNLAGVEVILHMTERIESLQSEVDDFEGRLETLMQRMRESIRSDIMQTIQEVGNTDDQHWNKILRALESRL